MAPCGKHQWDFLPERGLVRNCWRSAAQSNSKAAPKDATVGSARRHPHLLLQHHVVVRLCEDAVEVVRHEALELHADGQPTLCACACVCVCVRV